MITKNNVNKFTVLFITSYTLYSIGNSIQKRVCWIINVTIDKEWPFKPSLVKYKTKIYRPQDIAKRFAWMFYMKIGCRFMVFCLFLNNFRRNYWNIRILMIH